MNFVIKCYRSRDVDRQKFVVRTVNKLPHATVLLVHEQSLVLKGRLDIASCYSPASISAQFHALCLFWKCWYQRNFALLTHGLVTFHLAFGDWRVEWFWLCITHSSLFLASISEFLKIFYKERQSSSDGSLDRSSGVCYFTKGFWTSLKFLLYGLYVELWIG
jgi:hypothetical protein